MRLVACVLALVAGCGETRVVTLPLFGPEIASWAVARAVGEHLYVFAADETAPAFRFEPEEPTLRLEVRAFGEPLASQALVPGDVLRALPGESSRGLSKDGLSFSYDDDSGRWTDVDEERSLLREFRYSAPSPCSALSAEVAELDHGDSIEWAVSLAPEVVALGGLGGQISVVDARAGLSSPVIEARTGTSAPTFRSAFHDARGMVWLGALDGSLWRAEVSTTRWALERVAPPAPHGAIFGLDGDPADPERQLFAVTHSGNFLHLDRGQWTVVDSDPIPETDYPRVAILWQGVNDVFYGSSSWGTARRYTGVSQPAQLDAGGPVLALTELANGTVVAGTSAGLVSALDAGRFVPLEFAGGAGVFALEPRRDGFLYTRSFGVVAEWSPAVGFCPMPDPIAGSSVRFLVPIGDRWLGAGDKPRRPGNTVYSLITAP